MLKETEKYLLELINSLGYTCDSVNLVVSNRPELGQFQLNDAFTLAKINHENPREVAEKIVSKLDNRFTNVNIAGPGFINLSFTDEYLINYLNKGINDFNIFVDKQDKKTIIFLANAFYSICIRSCRIRIIIT